MINERHSYQSSPTRYTIQTWLIACASCHLISGYTPTHAHCLLIMITVYISLSNLREAFSLHYSLIGSFQSSKVSQASSCTQTVLPILYFMLSLVISSKWESNKYLILLDCRGFDPENQPLMVGGHLPQLTFKRLVVSCKSNVSKYLKLW